MLALTALSFSGLSFAQSKSAAPATPSADKKTETTSTKAKNTRVTGEITSLDSKSGMFSVKAKDKEVKAAKAQKQATEELYKQASELDGKAQRIRAAGYQPQVDLAAGIGRYLDWIRAQSDVKDYFSEAAQILRTKGIVHRIKM